MDEKIKGAFDQIHANEQLKVDTKHFVLEKMNGKREKQPLTFQRNYGYIFCVCFVFCMLFTGYHFYFTPTSVISIDINPSIEMDINRFNKVIDVNGFNDDGEDLADSLNVLYKNYEQAIDEVIASEAIQSNLDKDELLSIAVVQINGTQSDAILSYVKECTQNQKNTYCYGIKEEDMSNAHALGLSYGRYRLYLEFEQSGYAITPEQLNQMTMKEIRNLLNDIQSVDSDMQEQQENMAQQNGKKGNGNRYGAGNGMWQN